MCTIYRPSTHSQNICIKTHTHINAVSERQIRIGDKNNEKYSQARTSKWVKGYAHNMLTFQYVFIWATTTTIIAMTKQAN